MSVMCPKPANNRNDVELTIHKRYNVIIKLNKVEIGTWSYYFTPQWLVILNAYNQYIYKESRDKKSKHSHQHTHGHNLVCKLYAESKIISKELKRRANKTT